MAIVEIYDKPMCCSTGICGPDVDPVLPRFAADLDWLKSAGHFVERFNLAQHPKAFADHASVREVLTADGLESLPLVLIDGQIVSRAVYPKREQLAAWVAGKSVDSRADSPSTLPIADTSGHCRGDEGCC